MKKLLKLLVICVLISSCSKDEIKEVTPQLEDIPEFLKLGAYDRNLLSTCPQIGIGCASEFLNPTNSQAYETFAYSPGEKNIKILFYDADKVLFNIVNFENIIKVKNHHYSGNNGIEFGTNGQGLKIVRKNSSIVEIYRPFN